MGKAFIGKTIFGKGLFKKEKGVSFIKKIRLLRKANIWSMNLFFPILFFAKVNINANIINEKANIILNYIRFWIVSSEYHQKESLFYQFFDEMNRFFPNLFNFIKNYKNYIRNSFEIFKKIFVFLMNIFVFLTKDSQKDSDS